MCQNTGWYPRSLGNILQIPQIKILNNALTYAENTQQRFNIFRSYCRVCNNTAYAPVYTNVPRRSPLHYNTQLYPQVLRNTFKYATRTNIPKCHPIGNQYYKYLMIRTNTGDAQKYPQIGWDQKYLEVLYIPQHLIAS